MPSLKLASGAVVEWSLESRFNVARGVEDIDDSAGSIGNEKVGRIDVTSGITIQPSPVLGVIAVHHSAEVKHNHTSPLFFGFRQVGNVFFDTSLYAGRKNLDGSIVDSSTGLNRVWILDPGVRGSDSLAPHNPFAEEKTEIAPSVAKTVGAIDQPSSSALLRRKNSVTHVINYLFKMRRHNEFLTALYVEDTTGGRLVPRALEGVRWRYEVDLAIHWKAAVAAKATGSNAITSLERLLDISKLDSFNTINVLSAPPTQNLVKIMNDSIKRARLTGFDPNWSHTHHPEYEKQLIDPELNSLNIANPGFFDFSI